MGAASTTACCSNDHGRDHEVGDDYSRIQNHFEVVHRAAQDPLNRQDVDVVQRTWALITGAGAENIGVLLFRHIFTIAPEALSLYKFRSEPNVRFCNTPGLKAHSVRVVSTIGASVEGLNNVQALVPMLQDLAVRHSTYGVVRSHFVVVGKALLLTLEDFLKSAWSEKVQSAWAKVWHLVATTMIVSIPEVKAVPARGHVELYGLPVSMNSLGPQILITAYRCGKLVTTAPGPGTTTPEFLKLNPFHQIPAILDDTFSCAESGAILRYLAGVYAPGAYPEKKLFRTAFIDWALDRINCVLYADVVKCIYPVLGFGPFELNQAREATRNLQEFADWFLKEKFIGGTRPSIADYRLAPFIFAYSHPKVAEKSEVELPDRLKQFNKDFAELNKVHVSQFAEFRKVLNKDSPSRSLLSGPPVAVGKIDLFADKQQAGYGKVELFGAYASANAMGPFLLMEHSALGAFTVRSPGEATRTPEYLAMNPWGTIPTLKDGDFTMGESTAILRYLARSYAPEFYPKDPKKRAWIDWAMDRFQSSLYEGFTKTGYVALGYAARPEDEDDMKKTSQQVSASLQAYVDHFLKGKFVGGNAITIADFKLAPFFFTWAHWSVKSKCLFEVPPRVVQFNNDFTRACSSAKFLTSAGGYALKEMLERNEKRDQLRPSR